MKYSKKGGVNEGFAGIYTDVRASFGSYNIHRGRMTAL